MHDKECQEFSKKLKEVLGLELAPVAVSCVKARLPGSVVAKTRICRAILDAALGATVLIGRENNACFGASWHLGFHQIKDPKILGMVKKFVVEGEKLFCSYEALDQLISQMGDVPDNSASHFVLSPMDKAEFNPELVVFVVNPQEACRILTLAVFVDGHMPEIKIGGPTCRLSIIYPLSSGEINLSFYDYTSRKMCNVGKDKLLLSVPYARIPSMVESLGKCSAGSAKIEYPREFREFLQERFK